MNRRMTRPQSQTRADLCQQNNKCNFHRSPLPEIGTTVLR